MGRLGAVVALIAACSPRGTHYVTAGRPIEVHIDAERWCGSVTQRQVEARMAAVRDVWVTENAIRVDDETTPILQPGTLLGDPMWMGPLHRGLSVQISYGKRDTTLWLVQTDAAATCTAIAAAELVVK